MAEPGKDVPGTEPPAPIEIHTDDEAQYTDRQLADHAEGGLADCMEALGIIEDATAAAPGATEGPATLRVNPLVHAVASIAASAILANRLRLRVADTLDRISEMSTWDSEIALGRIATALEAQLKLSAARGPA